MQKKIIQAVRFILVLLALIYGVQYGLDQCYKQNAKQKFTRIFDNSADAEVMIFGSSVAYHQFDPLAIKKITGKTAYNMGWDGTFFVQYNALIREYLTYERKCKYMVIACDFDNLGKNNLITRPDLYLAYLNNSFVYEALHMVEPQKICRAKYLPGYKLTILNKAFYKTLLVSASGTDTGNGYSPSDIPWDKTGADKVWHARFEDQIYAQLISTIAAVTQKGIKVILVMTPVYADGYKLITNADQVKEKYKALVSKDVCFLDYTTNAICNTKSYFHNYSHLNLQGATLFSDIFSKDLLKITNE